MADIVLKPELRTSGGEATSIYRDGKWVGDMYLVYREKDMLTGTVNIDSGMVESAKVSMVTDKVQQYIAHLGDSLKVKDQDVNVVFGNYMNTAIEETDGLTQGLNVLVTGEDRNGIHYDIKTPLGNVVAKAFIKLRGTDLKGSLTLRDEELLDEVDGVVGQILEKFDRDLLDSVHFEIDIDGELNPGENRLPDFEAPSIEGENMEEWITPETHNDLYMKEKSEDTIHLVIVGEDEESIYYDIVDEREDTLAEVIFDSSGVGVEVSVHFLAPPSSRSKKRIIRLLTREAFAQDFQWIRFKMQHQCPNRNRSHLE